MNCIRLGSFLIILVIFNIADSTCTNVDCKTIRYFKIGCFADTKSDRAIGKFHGFMRLQDCMLLTSSKGYIAFGMQDGDECWTGPNAHLHYNKHGRSYHCEHGNGGAWANDVYVIDNEQ